jgi:hypothetical protein
MSTSKKDPVVTATERLEQALAAQWSDPDAAWVRQVREALAEVERALGRHPAPSVGAVLAPAGPPQQEISPGLTREVNALRKDHDAMLREVDVLIGQIERGTVRREDLPALRQVGAGLVKSLRQFTAAENAMILEAVMGEPGAGD